MNGKTGVRLLLIGTTIDITTKASRTSRRRRSTAESTCNFIAFVSVRSTSFGSSIPNDLFVGDHVRSSEKMNEKIRQVSRYWNHSPKAHDYSQIAASILQPFQGKHPAIVQP